MSMELEIPVNTGSKAAESGIPAGLPEAGENAAEQKSTSAILSEVALWVEAAKLDAMQDVAKNLAESPKQRKERLAKEKRERMQEDAEAIRVKRQLENEMRTEIASKKKDMV